MTYFQVVGFDTKKSRLKEITPKNHLLWGILRKTRPRGSQNLDMGIDLADNRP